MQNVNEFNMSLNQKSQRVLSATNFTKLTHITGNFEILGSEM